MAKGSRNALRYLRWYFFSYAFANGWGYVYCSVYSIAEVLAYLVAYALGIVSYRSAARPRLLARLAMLICFLGVGSFGIELSHWLFDHHLCLIASFPAVLLLIGGWTLISTFGRRPHPISA